MIWLREIRMQAAAPEEAGRFPFTVRALRELGRLRLTAAVTLLVGENGSGKSTLLEALAAAVGLPAVGAAEVADDGTLAAQRRLARALKLTWTRRTHRGFFLRAEDFFGFAKRVATMRAELRARLAEIDRDMAGSSAYAIGLAKGPVVSSLAELERRYGEDVDARSHGESFLELFRSRFVPGGLYLLDEPEAPLSPQNQLGLLALLGDMAAREAQFVIATHSPIVLACPGARIVSFDHAPPREVAYDELEHVQLTRAFLNSPESFLRRL